MGPTSSEELSYIGKTNKILVYVFSWSFASKKEFII